MKIQSLHLKSPFDNSIGSVAVNGDLNQFEIITGTQTLKAQGTLKHIQLVRNRTLFSMKTELSKLLLETHGDSQLYLQIH